MSSAVEQIKSRLNIVEVVSGYLKLEKAGVNWKARCPFHNEKTPSFFVSPARQAYHCFGCNRGGDMIAFVEEIEGLEFIEALKVLAERAGVVLAPLRGKEQAGGETRLYQLLAEAVNYYQSALKDQSAVQEYLTKRGLKPETIRDFGLGWAPAGWQNLHHHLLRQKFSSAEILKVGLVLTSSKGDGRLYDRFRSRIMFPLQDAGGRVVGFSGRVFGPAEEGVGKYVNSPETPLYHKSKILYGYDRAKVAIRRQNHCVVVEGQLDLIMSHQAGVTNAVALSGTALTTEQLALLRRLTDHLIIALDSDEAGLAAAERSLALALAAGFQVKVVALPAGEDPASLILRDPAAWSSKLAEAKPVIDFLLDHLAVKYPDRLELIHQVAGKVYPYLAALPDPHDRDHFVAKIAFATQLSENTIKQELVKVKAPAKEVDAAPSSAKDSRRERLLAELFGLHWLGQAAVQPLLAETLGAATAAQLEAELAPRRNELTLAAELAYAGMTEGKLAAVIAELGRELQLEGWREEVESLRFALARAEKAQNEAERQALLARLQQIYNQINNLKNQSHGQKE